MENFMNANQAIQTALQGAQHIMFMYVNDLSDADFLVRPVPNANHIAWQLGHLIGAEHQLGLPLPHAAYPELPANFAAQHTKDTARVDPPAGFLGREAYTRLLDAARQATIAALQSLSPSDLDKPIEGPMAAIAPNLGAMLLLTSNHTLMHAGQFSVVRRKLDKPILF